MTHTNQLLTDDFIGSIYDELFYFAKHKLQDDDSAKDVVQDTLANAHAHAHKFKGNSALKTWVFAILKNAIIDYVRQNKKYISISDTDTNDTDILENLFDDIGHWQVQTGISAFDDSWCNPENQAIGTNFWQVLDDCMTKLPPKQAQAFLLREYAELSADEVCQTLNITSDNYYVLIHRAKLRLQKCLSKHWFDKD